MNAHVRGLTISASADQVRAIDQRLTELARLTGSSKSHIARLVLLAADMDALMRGLAVASKSATSPAEHVA